MNAIGDLTKRKIKLVCLWRDTSLFSYAKLVTICYFYFSFLCGWKIWTPFIHPTYSECLKPSLDCSDLLSMVPRHKEKKNAWLHLLDWASDEQNLQHCLGYLVLSNVCWNLGTQIRSENLYIEEVTFKGLSGFQFGLGTCLCSKSTSVDNVFWAGSGDLLGFIFLFFPLAQSLLFLC